MDAIWILESYPNNKKWWSKKDNVLPRALAWSNVTKFEKNDYNRLFGPDSNPNLELYATPVEKQTGWFIAGIQFINGLVDEDLNVSQDDGVGVVSGNCVDLQHNSVSAVSVLSANSHEGLNETRVGNNDMLLLEGGDGFLDSEGGAKNPESNKDKQPTLADVLDEVRALRKEVALVKFDDARIAKLERLLNDNFMFRNDSPNGNHNDVNQGLSGSANHPMAYGKNDSPNGNPNGVNKGLSCSANDLMSTCSSPDILDGEVASALIGIHKADGKNDSPNVNHNAVNKGLSCSANDLMSTCSSPDMGNGEVIVTGMEIHKADGQNNIPNANHNAVNQGICGSANDPMILACDGMRIDKADGNNDYTYSQCKPSILDVLVRGFDSQKNHPGIDVLQHDTRVDCFVSKLNDHPTVDIGVKVVPVDEFADDFMDVLNDEESIPNYSLDDMKLQDEEEKLISTPAPVNHQQVDELIDVHEDKTTVLQENVKDLSNKSQYVNVVKEDYKPCLGMVFANVKAKRKKCGIERNYVLRSVKERKKRLAMSLDSPFGQQADTTPASPKTISRSVNGDFIAPPNFLEHLDLWIDLMWYFREPDADWAMVSPYFLTCTLGRSMIDYYSNGVRYPVAWRDVEKYVAELHISTGVVTFYDSLGWVCGNRRPWWRMMKRTLPQQLTLYLNEHGVLHSKGIAVETYEIEYMFLKVVRSRRLWGLWCMDYIPFEMQIEIMNRLPVKSLLQFRTISKSWKSCIDSSAFFFKYGVLEVSTGHIMAHTVQVYMGNSQLFENVAIQGNTGFWSGGLMSYLDLVKVSRHGL
ncbi:phospholipase-like protein [Tanacetum coccineum]|uniref:Phospholipase-like protein n=1 Tax=Tanacetum coccineum TaxID=301880 RepID=A0ABQ5AQI3_9ASTR